MKWVTKDYGPHREAMIEERDRDGALGIEKNSDDISFHLSFESKIEFRVLLGIN